MPNESTNSTNLVNELVEKIHQFLTSQASPDSELSEAARESLAVANDCIAQAYNISSRPPSNELLDIYKSHKQRQNQQQAGSPNLSGDQFNSSPGQFIQNLASSILNQATTGAANFLNPSAGTQQTQAGDWTRQQEPPLFTPNRPPRARKNASESEKMSAEGYKNLGNEAMKQENFREAYNHYTHAIDIDDNNAIYYSNRAAASSKLGNHQAALSDCQEAVEIDPTYSKAYGRMGLSYANLGDDQRAKEAYQKAVELDPNNESYRNNLRAAEEKLAQNSMGRGGGPGLGNLNFIDMFSNLANLGGGGAGGAAGGGGGGDQMMDMLRSVMNNPQMMQIAMQSLQDPRVQSLLGMQPSGQQSGGSGNDRPAPNSGNQ